ncbi:protein phosphatase 1 regulatory subunit 15A-like [Nasonia vitripennis]|uniref:Protein DP71L n=1 Tax=Nasonia vitripennis TaxID=7425 RepID=A0A7M7Q0F7_NASVI|nr:protein phosphatase 1 regulatory subunit 15A-like [Nasonia vitripennis]
MTIKDSFKRTIQIHLPGGSTKYNNNNNNKMETFNSSKEKCVRFKEEPTIHLMYTWRFAHHQARCGKWEEAARDRERFRRRIVQTNEIIMPVLLKKLKEM